jgi:hypothetical protein
MLKTVTIPFLLMTMIAAAPVWSLDRKSVRIDGNVHQKVKVDNAVNIGVGAGVKVRQSIGSIHGGVQLGGNVNQNVQIKNAVNIGVGLGLFSVGGSCQMIGSMGDPCR